MLPHLLQDGGKSALREAKQEEIKVTIPNKATAPPAIPVQRGGGEGGRESSCLSAVPHISSARPAENQPAAAGVSSPGSPRKAGLGHVNKDKVCDTQQVECLKEGDGGS